MATNPTNPTDERDRKDNPADFCIFSSSPKPSLSVLSAPAGSPPGLSQTPTQIVPISLSDRKDKKDKDERDRKDNPTQSIPCLKQNGDVMEVRPGFWAKVQ